MNVYTKNKRKRLKLSSMKKKGSLLSRVSRAHSTHRKLHIKLAAINSLFIYSHRETNFHHKFYLLSPRIVVYMWLIILARKLEEKFFFFLRMKIIKRHHLKMLFSNEIVKFELYATWQEDKKQEHLWCGTWKFKLAWHTIRKREYSRILSKMIP